MKQALEPLIGLPLWSMGRAGSLIWLQFGQKRRVKDWFGNQKTKTVGEYALHLQTQWRLTQDSRILVGRQDMYLPTNPRLHPDKFDWAQPGLNRCDRTLHTLFRRNQQPWIVQAVDTDSFGRIKLEFADGQMLETFTAGTTRGGLWRLFQAYENVPHFVVRLDQSGAAYIES